MFIYIFKTSGAGDDHIKISLYVLLQDLTVTDDTVLEEHNEDPSLVQMRLIGDGGNNCSVNTNFG